MTTEREEFEKWHQHNYGDIPVSPSAPHYSAEDVARIAWAAWQAALASRPEREPIAMSFRCHSDDGTSTEWEKVEATPPAECPKYPRGCTCESPRHCKDATPPRYTHATALYMREDGSTSPTPPAAPPAGDAELTQWLQDAPRRLRTTATPLADIIPRLQQAADRLTALSDELKLAQDRVTYMQASIDQLNTERISLSKQVAALTRERDELSSENHRFAKRHLTDIDNLFRMEQRAETAEARVDRMEREPVAKNLLRQARTWMGEHGEHNVNCYVVENNSNALGNGLCRCGLENLMDAIDAAIAAHDEMKA
jgi:FtsZ-binding cell division protein ZapB